MPERKTYKSVWCLVDDSGNVLADLLGLSVTNSSKSEFSAWLRVSEGAAFRLQEEFGQKQKNPPTE